MLGKFDKKQCGIACFEIDLDIFEPMKKCDLLFEEASKFPGIDFDLSLNVNPDMRFTDIENAWKDVSKSLKEVKVIDIYEAEGIKSITLRFSFGLMDRSLTGDEVQSNMDVIMNNLKNAGITLRA